MDMTSAEAKIPQDISVGPRGEALLRNGLVALGRYDEVKSKQEAAELFEQQLDFGAQFVANNQGQGEDGFELSPVEAITIILDEANDVVKYNIIEMVDAEISARGADSKVIDKKERLEIETKCRDEYITSLIERITPTEDQADDQESEQEGRLSRIKSWVWAKKSGVVISKVTDAPLRTQIRGINWLSKLRGGWKESRLDIAEFAQQNPAAYAPVQKIEDLIAETEQKIAEYKDRDDFDKGRAERMERVLHIHKQEHKTETAKLVSEYGERKLTRKSKIAIGIGAVAVAAGGIWAIRYGLSLTDGGHEHAQPKTGGSGRVPTPEETAFNEAYSKFNADEQDAFSQMVEASTTIKEAHPGASQQELDTIGRNTMELASAMQDWTPQEHQDWSNFASGVEAFDQTYSGFNPDQVAAFDRFVDGVTTIHEAHPDFTQAQTDTLVNDTLRLAAERESFVMVGSTQDEQIRLAQIFDEQMRRVWQELEELENATD